MRSRIAFLLLLCVAVSASAQLNRSAVSTTGLDTASCGVTDPCRTFAAALARTNPGGELVVLSSGGYGPFIVTHGVSIVAAPGVHAAITAVNGTAIGVSMNPDEKVSLKGLSIIGAGGDCGIYFVSGASLYLQDVALDHFNDIAIWLRAPSSFVSIVDTTIRRSSNTCIYVDAAAGSIRGVFDRVRLEDSSNNGLHVWGDAKVTMSNSTIAKMLYTGVLANDATSVATLESCVVTLCGDGVWASGGGIVRLSNCTITGNAGAGVHQSDPGIAYTRANNTFAGNATDVFGTLSTFSPK
jgi:nitrous oxidase accessory protein NosD